MVVWDFWTINSINYISDFWLLSFSLNNNRPLKNMPYRSLTLRIETSKLKSGVPPKARNVFFWGRELRIRLVRMMIRMMISVFSFDSKKIWSESRTFGWWFHDADFDGVVEFAFATVFSAIMYSIELTTCSRQHVWNIVWRWASSQDPNSIFSGSSYRRHSDHHFK